MKDSTDAINKISAINQHMEKDDILVTMDVRSLYTNIPNQERGGIHGHQSESITDRSTDGRSDGRMDWWTDPFTVSLRRD